MRECSVEGCGRESSARGYCTMHYTRWRRTGTTDLLKKERKKNFCTVEGCDKPCFGHGHCRMHYMRLRRTGRTDLVEKEYEKHYCTIEGCDKLHKAKGLCVNHYENNKKYGHPLGKQLPKNICQVDGCERKYKGLGYCELHYGRYKRTGSHELSVKEKKVCKIEGCKIKQIAKGYCTTHYDKMRNHGDPQYVRPEPEPKPEFCEIEGCERKPKHFSLCLMHYTRVRVHGEPGGAEQLVGLNLSCARDDCNAKAQKRGLCERHYSQFRSTVGVNPDAKCQLDGCQSLPISRGYCHLHYSRILASGDPGGVERRCAPNGAGTITPQGYRMITVNGKQEFEQRVVYSKAIGRPLKESEFIHHLNGDRLNNDISNLELWDRAHPPGQRVTDKISYYLEGNDHIVILLLHVLEEALEEHAKTKNEIIPISLPKPKPMIRECSIEDCSKQVIAKGYCEAHYARWRKTGVIGGKLRTLKLKYEKCLVEGCIRTPRAKGYCPFHYNRLRNGTPLTAPESKSIGSGHISALGYKTISINGRTYLEHRLIMANHLGVLELPSNCTVHHLNGIRSDNRISNLQLWESHHPPGQRVEDMIIHYMKTYPTIFKEVWSEKATIAGVTL